jgi:hypothetical protein
MKTEDRHGTRAGGTKGEAFQGAKEKISVAHLGQGLCGSVLKIGQRQFHQGRWRRMRIFQQGFRSQVCQRDQQREQGERSVL